MPIHSATMQEAAFFDLDKTIIARSSTLAFGRPLYQAGLLRRGHLVKMAVAQLFYVLFGADEGQLERARDELLHMIAGWRQADVERLVRETMERIAEPLVYAEALFLIDEHQRQGRRVFIVSASPEEIVRPIAEHIGVREVIATRVRTDAEGRYLPELERYAMGDGKAQAIREVAAAEGIDLAGSYAYSDSITDLPMLEVVGHPVAVNPDRDLRRVAEERDWPMLEFQRPVALERTIPRPSPLVAAAAGGVVAAAITAAFLFRRFRAQQA